MSRQPRFFQAWALALTLLPMTTGLAAPPPAAPTGRTQWKLSTFTWVQRVPAEAQAPPNEQPAQVTEAALTQALATVRIQEEGTEVALFAPPELPPLAKALREALALAQPTEDLLLLSTFRRGGHFLDPALAVTARLFIRGGALHLVVGETRLEFMNRYAADRTVPSFRYGSRLAPSPALLRSAGATALRPDWLALSLQDTATPKATQSMPLQPAPSLAQPSGNAPGAAQPSQPSQPGSYEALAQRLKALKRLREDNLITEAEYQQKRDAILKTL